MLVDIRSRCFVEGFDYSAEEILEAGWSLNSVLVFADCIYGAYRFRVCGFVVSEQSFLIVFPKGHVIPADNHKLLSQVRILAKTLLRYRNSTDFDELEVELLGGRKGTESEGIAAGLEIIDDYNKYGLLYRDREQEVLNGKGRIHWPRTVDRCLPVFSNAKPFYFDTVVRKKNTDRNDLIVRLHDYAVKRSKQLYGIIFDPAGFLHPVSAKMPCSVEQAEYALTSELVNCFRDRDIKLINLLYEFIVSHSDKNAVSYTKSLATPYFYNVWEAVCQHVFKHDSALQSLVPRPRWRIVDGDRMRTKNTIQIPDILYMYKGQLHVLDAKYYNVKKNLPGWGDLVKQFFYADTIENSGTGRPANVLIFPGNSESPIEYIGFAEIDEPGNRYGKVYGYSINTFSALDSYSRYSAEGYRRILAEKMVAVSPTP